MARPIDDGPLDFQLDADGRLVPYEPIDPEAIYVEAEELAEERFGWIDDVAQLGEKMESRAPSDPRYEEALFAAVEELPERVERIVRNDRLQQKRSRRPLDLVARRIRPRTREARPSTERHRGSRRVTRAGPSSDDDPHDGESDSPPPWLRLWRHPRFGSWSRVLVEAGS